MTLPMTRGGKRALSSIWQETGIEGLGVDKRGVGKVGLLACFWIDVGSGKGSGSE